jgi:hypothetical protein
MWPETLVGRFEDYATRADASDNLSVFADVERQPVVP